MARIALLTEEEKKVRRREHQAKDRERARRDREQDPEKRKAIKKRSHEKLMADPARAAEFRRKANERSKAWRKRKTKEQPGWEYPYQRARKLKILYNLTPQEHEALLERHNHRCAICGSSKNLAVDHCHDHGHIRGVLCGRCNRGLGLLGDNLPGVERALYYLQVNA